MLQGRVGDHLARRSDEEQKKEPDSAIAAASRGMADVTGSATRYADADGASFGAPELS